MEKTADNSAVFRAVFMNFYTWNIGQKIQKGLTVSVINIININGNFYN